MTPAEIQETLGLSRTSLLHLRQRIETGTSDGACTPADELPDERPGEDGTLPPDRMEARDEMDVCGCGLILDSSHDCKPREYRVACGDYENHAADHPACVVTLRRGQLVA